MWRPLVFPNFLLRWWFRIWGLFFPKWSANSILEIVGNLGGGFKYFYFPPYLGKISHLTNIFQMGWNHQLVMVSQKECQTRIAVVACVFLRKRLEFHFRNPTNRVDIHLGLSIALPQVI